MVLLAYIPTGSLWKGYVVLYASKEIPEQSVLETLTKNDVSKIITLSQQTVPSFSKQIPVQFIDNSKYVANRSNYFFDKNNNLQRTFFML